MLSLVTANDLVPEDHPLGEIKPMVDKALAKLSPTFNLMYAETGRPSIPPKHPLKGMSFDYPLLGAQQTLGYPAAR